MNIVTTKRVVIIHEVFGLFDTELDYILQFTVTRRCLVQASSYGLSLSTGFPNCSRPQLPISNINSSQRLSPRSYVTRSLTCHLLTNCQGQSVIQNYATADSQSTSLSWSEAPSGAQG
jgi:hypothetical protein